MNTRAPGLLVLGLVALVQTSVGLLDPADQQAQLVGELEPAFQVPSPAALAVQQLQSSVPSVQLVADLDSATDPDGLLGLPGQYSSKAQFSDSANPACPDGYAPTCFVEVFDNPSALASRARSLHDEADLSHGTILVRVLGVTAAPAGYQAALSTLVLP